MEPRERILLPRLIGLTGKSGCGKDVAASHLRNQYAFEHYRFAEPLKQGLCKMFGFSEDVWETDEKDYVLPHVGVSPRVLAQTLGTEWGRETVDKDLWVKLLQRRWNQLNEANVATFGPLPSLVVSDVRFDNEAQWIVKEGGTVIQIIRDVGRDVPDHASEAGINYGYVDDVVPNNGSLASFTSRFISSLNSVASRRAGVNSQLHDI